VCDFTTFPSFLHLGMCTDKSQTKCIVVDLDEIMEIDGVARAIRTLRDMAQAGIKQHLDPGSRRLS